MSIELSNDQHPANGIASEAMHRISRIDRWMYETVKPFLQGRMIELGSRNGNITDCFVADDIKLRISDPERQYCILLKEKYKDNPAITSLHRLDPESQTFEQRHAGYLNKFDTVILLNRVGSVPGNPLALDNIKKLLRINSHLIMLLPAHTALYEESDQAFEDWRRVNRRYIYSLLGRKFQHLKTQFFRIVNNEPAHEQGDMNLYYQQVPSFSIKENSTFTEPGLFMIAILNQI